MNERKLTELEPDFSDLQNADGSMCRALWFECPSCAAPGHSIVVPFAGKSPFPSGAIWTLHGSEDVETVTLTPSIDIATPNPDGSCKFHGFVTNGMVTW